MVSCGPTDPEPILGICTDVSDETPSLIRLLRERRRAKARGRHRYRLRDRLPDQHASELRQAWPLDSVRRSKTLGEA